MNREESRASTPPRRRRRTANQRAVLEVLGNSDRFRSAQQLYHQLREEQPGQTGLTTVYRILRTLVEDKVAEAQRSEDGELLYRLSTNSEHRHYLLCRLCGRADSFLPAVIEQHIEELVRQFNYVDTDHRLDLYGVCPGCRDTQTHVGNDT